MAENPQVYLGDCRAVLSTLESGSVQTCVTSPPYWGLRDYGTAQWEGGDAGCDHRKATDETIRVSASTSTLVGSQSGNNHSQEGFKSGTCPRCGARRIDSQLGLETTPEEYIANMVEVFREVWRVLRDDGTLFLNLGDSYFSGSQRAVSCDTSGKEPANFQGNDYAFGSLCDACHKAYQIGRSHSDFWRVPKQSVSPSEPSLGRKGLANGHVPTLDSFPREIRNEHANYDPLTSVEHERVQPLSVQESNKLESFQQHQAESRSPISNLGEVFPSFESSLTKYVQQSSDKLGESLRKQNYTEDNAELSGERENRIPHNDATCYFCGAYIQPQCSYRQFSHLLKPKDLCMMPARVALALQADGWYLRSDIIWHKPNPMPESVTDRPTKAHEYIFLLTKAERYFYDAEAVREAVTDDSSFHGSATFKSGANGDRNDGGTFTPNRNRIGSGYRNKRTVWTIATQPYAEAHFATFPEEIPKLCILAGSKPGDVILDPFAGSGTVGQVALELGRRAVLIELNPNYIELARDRTFVTPGFF